MAEREGGVWEMVLVQVLEDRCPIFWYYKYEESVNILFCVNICPWHSTGQMGEWILIEFLVNGSSLKSIEWF